jgi:hypothetical protein
MLKAEREQVYKELGVISPDRRIAYFYINSVFDEAASSGEAKRRILKETEDLNIERKKRFDAIGDPNAVFEPIEADFSPRNLKKYGARQKYKDVLMINVRHADQKDNKSRIATEEDKTTFASAWAKFQQEKQNQGKELKLLPNITDSIIRELNDQEIYTLEDLANSDNNYYPELKQLAVSILGVTNEKAKTSPQISVRDRTNNEEWNDLQVNAVGRKHSTQSENIIEFNYSFTI